MKVFKSEQYLYSHYYFIYFIGAGAFYPFIALYFKNFEFSETQIGIILSTAPLIGIIAQPLWGFLNDYLKREKLLMSILYIGTVGMLVALLLSDGAFKSILMFYLLVTFFICGLMPIIDRNVTSYCVGSKKIKFGQIRIWGSIAWGGSSFIIGKLIGLYGIELIIYVMITFLIFSGILFLMFPSKENMSKEDNTRICLKDIKELFLCKLFLIFTGLWLLHQIAMLGCNAYFSLYLVELGGGTDHVGLATMVGIIAEVPALLFFSSHSERFGELKLVLLALVLSIVRIFSYIIFPNVVNLIILYVLQGIVSGIFLAISSVYIIKIVSPKVQTTALTMFIAIVNGVGNWIGILAFGYFVEHMSYKVAYSVMLIPLFMALVIMIYMVKKEQVNR